MTAEPLAHDAPPALSVDSTARQRRGGSGFVMARLARGIGWLLVAVLAGLAVKKLVHDSQPLPDLARIDSLIRQKNVADAERLLGELVARAPRHGEALRTFARLRAQQGRMKECAELLHRIPEWWPDKREAQFLEGQAYLQANQARRAEAAWLACIRDDPLHPTAAAYIKNATQALVALYVLEHRPDAAETALWEAYSQTSKPEQPAVLGTMMRSALERIEPKEAVATLSAYVAADPDDVHARLALSRALQALGRENEADQELERCLHKEPESLAVWGTHLAILDERADSEALESSVKRMPLRVARAADSEIQKARAAVAEARGDLEDARASLMMALEADPYDESAHFRLARVEQRLGHAEAAQAHRLAHQRYSTARAAIPKALADFGQVNRVPFDRTARTRSIERLAELCATLGKERLAKAWRAVITNE